MCEILVKLKDGIDPKGIRTGDIVDIRPDGQRWGKLECEPNFSVIKLPGIDRVELSWAMDPWPNADGSPYRSRLWGWNFESEKFIRKSDGLVRTCRP